MLGEGAHSTYAASEDSTSRYRRDATRYEREKPPAETPEGDDKLGTFSGVFVPTTLNVLSILMFLRFGFILGQGGVLGMTAMLVICYLINLVTTLSISAIATNGTVRGGGAYYLISRSLGPEFGGSIGVVFYLGFVLNTGMNAVGLVDCFVQSFGTESGNMQNWLPEGVLWSYLWATAILLLCTIICLAGSGVFARASNGLLVLLLLSILSIPLSALLQSPFANRKSGVDFTGPSLETMRSNIMPRFTRGAAGSEIDGKESFQDLFGILFPATGGIFAGASMSGDLKHPSRAIPKGTLTGLAFTFLLYMTVILSMAATIARPSFYRNVNVLQDTNLSSMVILVGEFAAAFFSALMGLIGSAKLLQALARDSLLPGLSVFSQGTKKSDEPISAIFITLLVAQITIMFDINHIALFVTMTYLMTFLVTNLACFLLKISSAPNFRPSFHYFNWEIAAAGTIVSGITMFFVDGLYASGCVAVLIVLFLLIHYLAPPKSWGDVGQSLIYHQVRKYLLRLRQEEHVKYWRPQILLFVNDARSQYQLVHFCNQLKKGALFVLGHVIVSEEFESEVLETRKQQSAWTKYVEAAKVKAFVNIAIAPTVEWGVRNIVLSSGLGGMRPNIAVVGFYNLKKIGKAPFPTAMAKEDGTANDGAIGTDSTAQAGCAALGPSTVSTALPTDVCKVEGTMSVTSYVTILEDLLLRLRINVAVAKGFNILDINTKVPRSKKMYIDLWPIQMSAEIFSEGSNGSNFLTTNFDTYTLILQLGCILNTVPAWKKSYKLRVAVFVEYESDVEEERERVKSLLDNLRIEAEVVVFWLACGTLRYYEIFVNGLHPSADEKAGLDANAVPWQEDQVREAASREDGSLVSNGDDGMRDASDLAGPSRRPVSRARPGFDERWRHSSGDLRSMILGKRRHTMSGISKLRLNLGMRTQRLRPDLIEGHDSDSVDEDDSDSLSDTDVHELGRSLQLDLEARRSSGSSRLPRGAMKRSETWSVAQDRTPTTAFADAEATLWSGRPEPERSTSDLVVPVSTDLEEAAPQEPEAFIPVPLLDSPHKSRPSIRRSASIGKFTCDPVPETELARSETQQPSIMFAESRPPPSSSASRSGAHAAKPRRSIYSQARRASPSPSDGATTGACSKASAMRAKPLSFNDLPCRPQHLILNELMRQQSRQTAVVFSTLPSPVKGTCDSESDSLRYLADLDILCRDLPPTLLIHSNSMTVTTNL